MQNTQTKKIKIIIQWNKKKAWEWANNESAIAVIWFVCVFLCMQTGGAFGRGCGHYLGPSEKCEGLWEVPPCSTSADLSVWLLRVSGERHHMSVKHTYTHAHTLTTHRPTYDMKTFLLTESLHKRLHCDWSSVMKLFFNRALPSLCLCVC